MAETFEHSKAKQDREVLAPILREKRLQMAVALALLVTLATGYVTQHVLHWW